LPLAIRQMSLNDLEIAYRIEKECFSPTEAFSKDEYNRLLKSPKAIKLKALIKGRIAGFVVGLIRNSDGEIYTVNIMRKFRRRDIATTLIQALERSFSERGCKIVVAEISPDNKPSRELFKRLGYREVRVLNNFYGPGKWAMRVEKPL